MQLVVVDGLHGRHGVDGADLGAAIHFAQDDIARQHRTHPRLNPDGLVRHFRVAGPKDAVGLHLDVDLLFHRRLDVNLGQNAEAIFGQRIADAQLRLIDANVVQNAVIGIGHFLRLQFDNSEGLLRPNMFGTVSLIPIDTRMALTVPTEAIIRTGSAERVILKTGDGTYKPRLITTGLHDEFGEGGRTEVVQGLAPGEEVVASAQFLLDSESALSAGLMRMAPTDDAPADGTGALIALDREARIATIRHGALDALDWPAMSSRFAVRADVALDGLKIGQQVVFRVARGADGLLGLISLGSDDGVAATGNGRVVAITADGKLTLAHDPIPELGWPAMQMDMPVAGFDPASVPLDAPVEFDLSKGQDGVFTVVAVRGKGTDSGDDIAQDMTMTDSVAKTTPEAGKTPPITVPGSIDAVDPATRTATITHGPITETGMPGMTMDFAIDSSVDASALPEGREVTLKFRQNPDFSMTLVGITDGAGE